MAVLKFCDMAANNLSVGAWVSNHLITEGTGNRINGVLLSGSAGLHSAFQRLLVHPGYPASTQEPLALNGGNRCRCSSNTKGYFKVKMIFRQLEHK